eukprot:186079_1
MQMWLFYTVLAFNIIINFNAAVTIFQLTSGNEADIFANTNGYPSPSSYVSVVSDSGKCAAGTCLRIHATNQANAWARWDPAFFISSYMNLHLSFEFYHNGMATDVTREC